MYNPSLHNISPMNHFQIYHSFQLESTKSEIIRKLFFNNTLSVLVDSSALFAIIGSLLVPRANDPMLTTK